jgi:predicted O-linked N-acetylglucosamine transferase (SPINDLY family)
MHSAMLYLLHCSPRLDSTALFDEHVQWANRFARPHYPLGDAFKNHDRTKDRRLRVGYVSPDFRDSPFARFAEPILAAHDYQRFEVQCYSDVLEPDAMTRRLRTHVDRWQETQGLSDDSLAERIRSDGIDILVDLTGHFYRNRLLVFARKPAPVQVSYIGYPDTTGLATMDWRISDSCQDLNTDSYHTEKLYRLDPCCWCYNPGEDLQPVNELPALRGSGITFGVFNRLIKMTSEMAILWSKVLDRVPGSKLMVLVEDLGQTTLLSQWMELHGIPRSRLQIERRRPRQEYLRLYHGVDIALDTYPYAGHTTTCDAMWMGVPTVTLVGDNCVSRAGASVLTAAGLVKWVTETEADYVDKAVAMALNIPKLAELRRNLRHDVSQSRIGDGANLTRLLEEAYCQMWNRWCDGQ